MVGAASNWATVLLWAVAAAFSLGQDRPLDAPRDEPALGQAYIDERVGFSLRPPADSAVEPLNRLVGPTRMELVRFVVGARDWQMHIGLRGAAGDARPSTVLDAMRSEFPAPTTPLANEPRVVILAAHQAATATWPIGLPGATRIRHAAAIAVPPNRFLTIELDCPPSGRAAAKAALDATLATLRFPNAELAQAVLVRAGRNAMPLLGRLRERIATLEKSSEQHLSVTRDGRIVGLIRLAWSPDTDGITSGLRVEEELFSFADDGAIREARTVAYTSEDLASERWELTVWETRRQSGAGVVRRVVYVERALRERNMLALAYSERPGQRLLTNRTVEIPAGYCPLAAVRLLPELIIGRDAATYALPVYSPQVRGIVTRIVRVQGPESIDVGGRSVTAYRMADRDRIIGDELHRVFDQQGKLLMATRGSETMTPVDKETARRMLQQRIAALRRQITSQPATPTTPGPEPQRKP